MLKLRQKAHASLASFRDGKPLPLTSGLASDPSSPLDEEDELFTLGGKTRLVAKDATLSPTLSVERSPTTHNPVVPLPLSPTGSRDIHPNLVEYLRTFGPGAGMGMDAQAQAQAQAQGMSGYDPHQQQQHHQYTLPPMQMADQSPTSPYQTQAPASASAMVPHGGAVADQQGMSAFPQYFPVFDYGPASGEFPPMSMTAEHMVEGPGRRDSRTPENMQTTWQDFVAQLGM
jgi:hypothetical protein